MLLRINIPSPPVGG